MIALLLDDCEFLLPGDPWPTPVDDANPLDSVASYWGLGLYEQNALRWLVNTGGIAYVSDLVALRGFAADGYAVVDEAGRWTATTAGRDLYAGRAA